MRSTLHLVGAKIDIVMRLPGTEGNLKNERGFDADRERRMDHTIS